jgi:molybdate transport system substrate-binding protein
MPLHVLSARAINEAVKPLVAEFTRTTGIEVAFNYGPAGVVRKQFAAGAPADILVLPAATMAELEQAGAILRASLVPLGRTSIGVAYREGAAPPDISTAEAFRQALVSAKSIALSDRSVGGTAGTYINNLVQSMGIADELEKKMVRAGGGNEVAERVAEGTAEIGMTFISEILPIKGAAVAGALPPPYRNDTTYTAGIVAKSTQADACRALLKALTDPAGQRHWTEAGFERPA